MELIQFVFFRYTRERPRFEEKKDHEKDLDIVKFVCKEFWIVLFKKQVDNLKTNHRVRTVSSAFIVDLSVPIHIKLLSN